MPMFDLPLSELETYSPDLGVPADLDAFWESTLNEARSHPLSATFAPHPSALRLVDVFDVRFAGFGGEPVAAWLILPAGTTRPLPCVVQFAGYHGGRGLPHQSLRWPSAGLAHLIMDNRGQGSAAGGGVTADPVGSAPHVAGWVTSGIGAPETSYYRRLYTDAVRAVEAARAHPLVDGARVAVAGASQGGGTALAVAGLVPDLVAALPDVPFLCHPRRAVEVTDAGPFGEIVRYLAACPDRAEAVFRTLSYVDPAVLGTRAICPALFSVGLRDEVCPPSTVYAAFNAYGGPKRMSVYAFNGHEGGGARQEEQQFRFVDELLAELRPLQRPSRSGIGVNV
jgi:cephalosporin-C deacetylase